MTKMKALQRQWCELQQAVMAECGRRLGGKEACQKILASYRRVESAWGGERAG